MSEIDTTIIRHVTKSGANLFLELGFAAEEAERYQAESRKRIDETLTLKVQLMTKLAMWIKDNHLKQEQAAEIFKVTRSRIAVQIWVPNTRGSDFAERCRRQSSLTAQADMADTDLLYFMDKALAGVDGWME